MAGTGARFAEDLTVTNYADPGYFLRVSIAFDDVGESMMGRGIQGVTISARAGTAEYDYQHGAHERHHLWGVWLSWLLDRVWPFGRDPATGERHVVGAIKGDRWRAYFALKSLWHYYPDAELVEELRNLLETPQ